MCKSSPAQHIQKAQVCKLNRLPDCSLSSCYTGITAKSSLNSIKQTSVFADSIFDCAKQSSKYQSMEVIIGSKFTHCPQDIIDYLDLTKCSEKVFKRGNFPPAVKKKFPLSKMASASFGTKILSRLLRATLSKAKRRLQSRASFCGHIW